MFLYAIKNVDNGPSFFKFNLNIIMSSFLSFFGRNSSKNYTNFLQFVRIKLPHLLNHLLT